MNVTYDKSWYTELCLGLNAMAVTAPICPRKTEIGYPSGMRHCSIQEKLQGRGVIQTMRSLKWKLEGVLTTRML